MSAPATDAAGNRHVSPWSGRAKLGRLLWSVVAATLFRWSPRPCYRWRNWLLRRFGATVHPTARVRPSATIEVPWNLRVGEHAQIGDSAIVYCLGTITIGARTMISQYSHLCAGTHDHTQRSYPLLRQPIAIGDDVWLAADVFVGPNVTIGDGVVVGARSTVVTDLPPWKICVGAPARPVRDREWN